MILQIYSIIHTLIGLIAIFAALVVVLGLVGGKRLDGWTKWFLITADVATLAELLRETGQHHGNYEKTHGTHNWWDWYAPYMRVRQNGSSPKEAATAAARYMEER